MTGPPSLMLNLWGLSREPTLSIWAARTKEGRQFLFHVSPQQAAVTRRHQRL